MTKLTVRHKGSATIPHKCIFLIWDDPPIHIIMERLELVREALRHFGAKGWCKKDNDFTRLLKKKQTRYDRPKWDDIWGKKAKFDPVARDIEKELRYINERYRSFVQKDKLAKTNKVFEDLINVCNSKVNMVYWDLGKRKVFELDDIRGMKGMKEVHKILADKFEKMNDYIDTEVRKRMKTLDQKTFKRRYGCDRVSLEEWRLAVCTEEWLNDKLKSLGGDKRIHRLDIITRLRYIFTLGRSSTDLLLI